MGMQTKTCCVTGHRNISDQQLPLVKQQLQEAVQQAIADGYTRFLSGFANGADLIFAAVVADAKAQNPELLLEAAIPYEGRLNSKHADFYPLLQTCDSVYVACEQYVPTCFMKRNRYMVEASQRIIAVYDGRKSGGTFHTIRYAHKLEREIQFIRI